MAKGFTQKQAKFIDAYMGKAKGNATEAASLAGYAGNRKTLEAVGRQNLANPRIAAEIERLSREDPLIATREDRQRFWTSVMNDEMQDMKDRLRASEILGKSQIDFVERSENKHDVEVRINRVDKDD